MVCLSLLFCFITAFICIAFLCHCVVGLSENRRSGLDQYIGDKRPPVRANVDERSNSNIENSLSIYIFYPQGRIESGGHHQEPAATNNVLEKDVNSISKADGPVEDGGGSQVWCVFIITPGTWACCGMSNKFV